MEFVLSYSTFSQLEQILQTLENFHNICLSSVLKLSIDFLQSVLSCGVCDQQQGAAGEELIKLDSGWWREMKMDRSTSQCNEELINSFLLCLKLFLSPFQLELILSFIYSKKSSITIIGLIKLCLSAFHWPVSAVKSARKSSQFFQFWICLKIFILKIPNIIFRI